MVHQPTAAMTIPRYNEAKDYSISFTNLTYTQVLPIHITKNKNLLKNVYRTITRKQASPWNVMLLLYMYGYITLYFGLIPINF